MKKQFLILGAGKFGQSIAHRLTELGQEVMVVDQDMEVVQQISDKVHVAIQGDATHEAVLREIGVRNFDVVIVSIGNDMEASIMVTLLVKEMECKYIVSKAESDLHAKVLYKIGANRVVLPEKDMGIRIAQNLVNKNILDFINLSDEYSIVEMSIDPDWVNQTVAQVDLRRNYGLNIVAIKHDEDFTIKVAPDTKFQADDTILVVGEIESIEKLSNESHK